MRARLVDRVWTAALCVAIVITLARGLHDPGTYATGHWLLSWDHGVIKRGLVGTLVRPLLAWKSPSEVATVVRTLGLASLAGALVALVASSRALDRPGAAFGVRWAQRVAVLAVATSAWTVLAGNLAGYFDHLLELAVLACVALAGTRGRAAIPALCVVAVATHELFLLYGLPVVAFAVLLAGARTGRGVRDALVVVGVTVLAAGALVRSTAARTPDEIAAIEADVASYGILGERAAGYAVFHLENDAVDMLGTQARAGEARLLRGDVDRAVWPPVALLVGWMALWSASPGTRRWGALAVPVTLAPLALHFVASDTPRFTAMVVFQGFATWLAIARHLPPPPSGRWVGALAVGGLAVVVANARTPVPLLSEEVDGDGAFSPRPAATLRSFRDCVPVFPDAGFEKGSLGRWTATGAAFQGAVRPATGERGERLRTGSVGGWWLESRGDGDAAGDAPTGRLVSPTFAVRGDTLLFTVGGGRDPERLRVSLYVDDTEVAWATGHDGDRLRVRAWDVRAWRGRAARIEIRDDASGRWGHLDVDGFCWFRPSN